MTTQARIDPASRTDRGRQAQLAVVAAFVINGLLFASWAAHIPGIKSDLGLSDGTLGLALIGTPIGSVSAMALCSWLLPRVGSRPVVIVSLVGYALCGPLIGIVGSVAGLFVALMLWGAFQGTLDVAMNTQAIAVEHHQNRPLMNGFHAWWSVGAFLGAGIGAGAVATGVSLTPQLLVLAPPAIVIGVLLTLRMLPDAAPRDEVTPDPVPVGRRLSPAMLLLGAIAFASMLCEGAAADWSSVYVRDSLDGGREAAGLAFTAFALAMVVVRIFGNRLLARFAIHRLLPALALLASLAFSIGLAVGGVVLAVIAFFALGLGLGAVVPSAFSAAGRLPGLHPGVAVAVVSSLGWVGFVCGPPLIGQLAAATSLPAALIVVPVLMIFIALTSARVRVMRHVPEEAL
ncbi:MAG: MFS transporter [Jatrophihabitans sp.]